MKKKLTFEEEDELEMKMWHDPEFYKKMSENIRKENFALGLPICYMDDQRRLVHEFEDGRIEVIKQL